MPSPPPKLLGLCPPPSKWRPGDPPAPAWSSHIHVPALLRSHPTHTCTGLPPAKLATQLTVSSVQFFRHDLRAFLHWPCCPHSDISGIPRSLPPGSSNLGTIPSSPAWLPGPHLALQVPVFRLGSPITSASNMPLAFIPHPASRASFPKFKPDLFTPELKCSEALPIPALWILKSVLKYILQR